MWVEIIMTFVEAYWISQLALIAVATVFLVEDWEHGCGTVLETITTLGTSCPT